MDSDRNSNRNINASSDCHCHCHCYHHGDSYPNAYANPMHGQMCTDTEASPHSVNAPIAFKFVQSVADTNRPFQFQKRCQLFVGLHNKASGVLSPPLDLSDQICERSVIKLSVSRRNDFI